MAAGLTLLASGLAPGNDQARQWARDELSRHQYGNQGPGVAERIRDWILDRLADVVGTGKTVPGAIAIIAAVLVVILIIYLVRFVRRSPRARRTATVDGTVLGGTALSAKQSRARAADLLAAGDIDGCVREAMRAVALRSFERVLLDDAPSLTAHEMADRLSAPFPDFRPRLAWAAGLFDAIVYGHRHAHPDEAAAMLDLEAEIDRTRPANEPARNRAGELAVPR